jgi:hypothetical protein
VRATRERADRVVGLVRSWSCAHRTQSAAKGPDARETFEHTGVRSVSRLEREVCNRVSHYPSRLRCKVLVFFS